MKPGTTRSAEGLKPGRELDALIAEKVMGTGWCQLMKEGYATKEIGPKKCKCGAIGFPYEHHAPYSTDIAAAWEVLNSIHAGSPAFITELKQDPEGLWSCFVSGANEGESYEGKSLNCDSAPHAICLAALAAVGGSGHLKVQSPSRI